MYPELFKIGPFTVYSFGVMLGLAIVVSTFVLYKEAKRKNLDIYFTLEVVVLAILSEVVGGKILFIIENFSKFLKHPVLVGLSPEGSTFYGGFILGVIVFYIYLKIKKIPFPFAADIVAVALPIAYGLGRIGCHLAGDGDYGTPTNLPWGTNYENGVMPPSVMFRINHIPNSFPNGIVPDNTPLHPTPVYEFIAAMIIFFILWKYRKHGWIAGRLFMLYLILSSLSRFLVEFIRLNPRILFGLSEAQLISIMFFIIGLYGFYKLRKSHFISAQGDLETN
ncbi:MAG: prolipoprotein diacylglyceryl transferase [Ignavibacteriaceae bacterium]|jgi:phosphatidylglycerol---prolipoprotein diacylglyceryl transferase